MFIMKRRNNIYGYIQYLILDEKKNEFMFGDHINGCTTFNEKNEIEEIFQKFSKKDNIINDEINIPKTLLYYDYFIKDFYNDSLLPIHLSEMKLFSLINSDNNKEYFNIFPYEYFISQSRDNIHKDLLTKYINFKKLMWYNNGLLPINFIENTEDFICPLKDIYLFKDESYNKFDKDSLINDIIKKGYILDNVYSIHYSYDLKFKDTDWKDITIRKIRNIIVCIHDLLDSYDHLIPGYAKVSTLGYYVN